MGRKTSDMIGTISRNCLWLNTRRMIVSVTLFIALGCLIARSPAKSTVFNVSADSPHPSGATVYPGQEVSLDIRLSVPAANRPRIEGWPELRLNNARTADFTGIDTPARQFYASRRETREVDGEEHLVFVLSTRISFPAPGSAGGQGELTVSALESEQRPAHPLFRDHVGDDWLSGRSRQERRISFELPDFQAAPLPAPPPGMWLGLVGEWRLQSTVSNRSPQVGESIELILRAEGDGDPRAFAAAPLQIAGWRSRGPQFEYRRLTEQDSRLTIRWLLAPELPGAIAKNLVWLTFCPRDEAYIRHETPFEVTVGEEPREARPPLAAEDMPALLTIPPPDMMIPWWRNRWWLAGTAVLLAALAFAAAAATPNPDDGDSGERAARRRRQCRRLQERLRQCEDHELSAILRHEVVPWLIEVWHLEPGTTPEELAERWRHSEPELAALLKTADHLEFAPHRQRKAAEFRRLANLLPRLLPVILAGCLMIAAARTTAAGTGSLTETAQSQAAAGVRETQLSNPQGEAAETDSVFHRAVAAYYRGEFEQAERLFASLQKDDRVQPGLLYNRANCLLLQDEHWRALVLFEQACRAAPRDSRLRRSRDALRSQLGLPPASSRHWSYGMVVAMRDKLRPDEWLALAAWSLTALGLGLWRRRGRPGKWSRIFVNFPLAVLILTMTALVWQLNTTYKRGEHAVLLTDGPMYVAPTQAAERLHLSSPSQREVYILEQRRGWLKVRGEQIEGWLPRRQVEKIW